MSPVDDYIAGIQLALFELIWPVFEWINVIYLREEAGSCHVYLLVNCEPAEMDLDDCQHLLGEIFDVALSDTGLRLRVSHGKHAGGAVGEREVMSSEIFKMIAKEVAPWRLDAGR